MKSNYSQLSNVGTEMHFSQAAYGEIERSSMTASPVHVTTFDGGQIVPIYCREILPMEVVGMDMDFVIRQMTMLTPTMGSLMVDYYAFFVPNRVVNRSTAAVFGENYSGSWTANHVEYAPLKSGISGDTQIPVCSVADYYGFPTQLPIPNAVLSECNDLKFRGYVAIYNEYFRDQNYEPPIPMSTLNVYQGFLDNPTSNSNAIFLDGVNPSAIVAGKQPGDGSFVSGAIQNALYGSGYADATGGTYGVPPAQDQPTTSDGDLIVGHFKAYKSPLKANKLHDYFTSVLPSAQKGPTVFVPATGGVLPVLPLTQDTATTNQANLRWRFIQGGVSGLTNMRLGFVDNGGTLPNDGTHAYTASASTSDNGRVIPTNLWALNDNNDPNAVPISLDISDLRQASAIQQIYETLARGGSRYRSYVKSFFGVEVDDPFDDIPKRLGHFRRNLDVFQTAQTSASTSDSAQGNLAAFGYTSNSGRLFDPVRFLEHGYLHVFAVVRHKNIYPTYLAPDNFRRSMLDFYHPQLANISEQPVFRKYINPFAAEPDGGFGFQEAWAEYRYEPDYVTGRMRPGLSDGESLAIWNYADDFDSTLSIATADWLKSNTADVVKRTLAVQKESSQFKAQFRFKVWKELPMPTYSVPGMDII